MRHHFTKMLKIDDRDDATDAIVQRFWSRATRLPTRSPATRDAQVVDMARWARSRGYIART
ncbi:MAG: hypothetical protein ACLP1X_25695 [Polyangiaceae bacterium]|jgi:hypothetical protein